MRTRTSTLTMRTFPTCCPWTSCPQANFILVRVWWPDCRRRRPGPPRCSAGSPRPQDRAHLKFRGYDVGWKNGIIWVRSSLVLLCPYVDKRHPYVVWESRIDYNLCHSLGEIINIYSYRSLFCQRCQGRSRITVADEAVVPAFDPLRCLVPLEQRPRRRSPSSHLESHLWRRRCKGTFVCSVPFSGMAEENSILTRERPIVWGQLI